MSGRLEFSTPDGTPGECLVLGGDGDPVVVLDGPRSWGLARAMDDVAREAGVRLLAPRRPAGSTIAGWPAVHAAVLDAAGCADAGVIGQSGGTPFALSAAAGLASRVRAVALVGAFYAPWARAAREGLDRDMRISLFLGRHAPGLLRRMTGAMGGDPQRAADRVVAKAPAADQAVLAEPAMRALHDAATREILAAPAELADEMIQVARPWGIDVSKVTCPVAIWSGTADRTHPTGMARRLVADLPAGARLVEVEGAGTFALRDRYPEVLAFARGGGPAR